VIVRDIPLPVRGSDAVGPSVSKYGSVDRDPPVLDPDMFAWNADDTFDQIHPGAGRIVKHNNVASFDSPRSAFRDDPVT
jgi:hypothetical protein